MVAKTSTKKTEVTAKPEHTAKAAAPTPVTAVATAVPKNLPVVKEENPSWGAEGIDMSDVKIPKLLLMQGQSELVAEGKAGIGDIVRSTNGEIVCKRGDTVYFIPLLSRKTWRIMEKEKDKFEFRRVEPFTDENKTRPWSWTENGTEWRADQTLGFFALLPVDIEREQKAISGGGDIESADAALIPVLIEFTRTSYKAGRDVITHFAHARKFRKPPAYWSLALMATAVKNDLGAFQVFKVEKAPLTSPAHLALAKEWYDIIVGGAVKIDEAAAEDSDQGVPTQADVTAAELESDQY